MKIDLGRKTETISPKNLEKSFKEKKNFHGKRKHPARLGGVIQENQTHSKGQRMGGNLGTSFHRREDNVDCQWT